jgi:hypothetical protein
MASAMKHITDTKTEGVGKYAKGKYSRTLSGKTVEGLTRRQAYKLESKALKNERLKINAKPEMIRAIGSAFAQNLAAPSAGLAATAGSNLINYKNNQTSNNVTSLIGGGAQQAGKDNEEEIESLQDQYQVR